MLQSICVALIGQDEVIILEKSQQASGIGNKKKLKNDKAANKDEVTGEMIKSGDKLVIKRIWKL